MTPRLAAQLQLGPQELVAFVGAGGKSTLLLELGNELAAGGARVVLTTTTKMGAGQARQARVVCQSTDLEAVSAALDQSGPVMVVATDDGHKVTGPSPGIVSRMYTAGVADYVLVEADGARGRSFKTPAEHEPVIPSATTAVVVVFGIDAIGRPIIEMCHRPDRVAALAGLAVSDVLDAAAAVRVVTHPEGVMRSVPKGARVVVAVTKVGSTGDGDSDALAAALSAARGIERWVPIATTGGRDGTGSWSPPVQPPSGEASTTSPSSSA